MPIAEPAGELWPLVKAQSGWPESDEDQMRTMGAGWRRQGDAFVQTGRFDLSEIRGAWPDEAGTAYDRRAGGNLGTAARTGSEMVELGRRSEAYAEQVSSVKTAINDLIARNNEAYGTLDPAFKGRFVSDVAVMVNQLLDQGTGNVGSIGGAPLGRVEPPPPGTSPEDVRRWWDSVPAGSRQTLIAENPDAIRNLDGIPADVRNQANRAVINREITTLEARQATLQAEVDAAGDGPRARPNVAALVEINDIEEKVGALKRLQAEGHLVLGFDTAGDGKAIVAIGNPDTARNVSTYVPGTFADLGGIGGEIDRADRLRQAAGASDTSVIAWVGYDAPPSIPDAAANSYADGGGAEDLARFQDGLRATHGEGRAHQSVIGHSYGTVVIGHAARDYGLNADSIGLVASPGVGVEHASELKLDGVPPAEVGRRVYALTDHSDPIRDSHITIKTDDLGLGGPVVDHVHAGHGHDPTEADFGAQRINTDNLHSDQHGGYFEQLPDGTLNPTLYSLGDVIANRPVDQ